DAVDRPAPDQRQRRLEVGHERVEVALLRQFARAHFVRIEVAVRTLLQAPGQVHVKGERRQRRQLQRAGAQVVRRGVHSHRSRTSASIWRAACPRWLWAFFNSGANCAKVRPNAGTTITGSKPKPWSPAGASAI